MQRVFHILLAIALFFALNLIVDHFGSDEQLDVTQNGFYTLSSGTKNILGHLQEPIRLRFYYSKQLGTSIPTIDAYAKRTEDLLEEYQRLARGKISLEKVYPEPFSEQEDAALGFGLDAVPVNGSTDHLYFGLVASGSTNNDQVISFFQPSREAFLEYDLTALIDSLGNPKKKKVGLLNSVLPLDGHSLYQTGGRPWIIYEQMKELYEVVELPGKGEAIPADLEVLILLHPKNMSAVSQYAVDQYVMKGGHLIALLDPMAETDEPETAPKDVQEMMRYSRASMPGPLLKSWGVELDLTQVVADISLARQVQLKKEGRNVVEQYPVWMDFTQAQYSAKEIATSDLGNTTFVSPGAIRKSKEGSTQVDSLVHTTDQAMLVDSSALGVLLDLPKLLAEYKAQGSFDIAVRIRGKASSAFPEGKPVETPVAGAELDAQGAPVITTKVTFAPDAAQVKEGNVQILLIADTDWLQDRFWTQVQDFFGQRISVPYMSNGNLLVNFIDNMSGSSDLISVRNRGTHLHPFTKVEEIQQQAEQTFRAKEQDLLARLKDAEGKLAQLAAERSDSKLGLTPAQEQEILQFRDQQISIRKDLRDVQHQLRKDIEGLETKSKFFAIWLMPLLIALSGVVLALRQSRLHRGKN